MRLSDLAHLIAPEALIISANDYAVEALWLMEQHQASWMFVLEGELLLGVVFVQDMRAIPLALLKERDVREFVCTSLASIDSNATLTEIWAKWGETGRRMQTLVNAVHLPADSREPSPDSQRSSSCSQKDRPPESQTVSQKEKSWRRAV